MCPMNVEIISKTVSIILSFILFVCSSTGNVLKCSALMNLIWLKGFFFVIKGNFGNTIQCNNVGVRIKESLAHKTASLELTF